MVGAQSHNKWKDNYALLLVSWCKVQWSQKAVSYEGLYVSHGFQESHWLYQLKSLLIPGDFGIGYEVCKCEMSHL